MASAIRLGERVRQFGWFGLWRHVAPRSDTWYNHVAIVITPADGRPRVVQATGSGVVISWLSDLGTDYIALAPWAFPGVVKEVPDHARVVTQAMEQVGNKYGWLTIFSIVVNILTPKWFRFPAFRRGGTFICSALGAWCLHAAGAKMDVYDIYQVLPSELRQMAS